MNIRLTLEYDGSEFTGWARQPGFRTVEGELRTALDRLFPVWGELAVAGRTDAGVHALAQVVSLDAAGGPPPGRIAEALNTLLPGDVAVVASAEAPKGFHARHSATSRRYRYIVLTRPQRSALERRRALWWPRPVDLDALERAAAAVVGIHDFTAFTPAETHHHVFSREVRSARWERVDDVLTFTIAADSFLRHMVRTLVGTMLDGIDLEPLLAGAPRSAAGRTAPAHGLVLDSVEYLDDGLADEFLEGSLSRPPSDEERVRIAVVVLRRLGSVAGRAAVTSGLRALSARHAVPDPEDDTLTPRWLDRIERELAGAPAGSLKEFLRSRPQLLPRERDA